MRPSKMAPKKLRRRCRRHLVTKITQFCFQVLSLEKSSIWEIPYCRLSRLVLGFISLLFARAQHYLLVIFDLSDLTKNCVRLVEGSLCAKHQLRLCSRFAIISVCDRQTRRHTGPQRTPRQHSVAGELKIALYVRVCVCLYV